MVALAAHRAAPPARRPARPRRAGFTLLEMMIVLVLISVLTGLVTINVRPDPRRALAEQAERVGLLMGIAADESRLSQQPIAWEADLHAYRFVRETPDGRATFEGDEQLRERAWDPALTRLTVVDLASGSARTLLNADAPPLRVAAAHEWVQPRWRLELASEQAAVAVDFDANGRATLQP